MSIRRTLAAFIVVITGIIATAAPIHPSAPASGVVSSVDVAKKRITINAGGTYATFNLRVGTILTLNGQPTSLDAISVGSRVKVHSQEPGYATKLEVTGEAVATPKVLLRTHSTLPEFAGIRAGMSLQQCEEIILKREGGLKKDQKESSGSRLVFEGGTFLGRPVYQWGFDFGASGFARGAASIRPESDRSAQLDEIKKVIAEKYGPPSSDKLGGDRSAAWIFVADDVGERIVLTCAIYQSRDIGPYVKVVFLVERKKELQEDL